MAGPGLDPRALVRPAAAYTVVVPARHRERITSVRHGARPTAVQTTTVYVRRRLLVAAHILGGRVRDGDSVREVPACLSLFHIGDDGLLTFVRKLDIDVGEKNMFWMGIIDL